METIVKKMELIRILSGNKCSWKEWKHKLFCMSYDGYGDLCKCHSYYNPGKYNQKVKQSLL